MFRSSHSNLPNILPLFAGYTLLLLVLHWPVREPAYGLLALPSVSYLPQAVSWNPVQIIAGVLGVASAQLAQALLIPVLALLFLLWLRAVQTAGKRHATPHDLHYILLGTVCLCVPLLLLPYLLSSDIYIYITRGRISALYGGNPLLDAAIAYPHDPFLAYLPHWRESAPIYGPTWMLYVRALIYVAQGLGGAEWVYVGLFKLAALAQHMMSVTLVWSLLGRWQPVRQLWGTLLYAWSPLLLIELVGNAHNDGLMIMFVLAGLWLAQREYYLPAVFLLLLATLTKYAAAPLLVLYVVFVLARLTSWRTRFMQMVQISSVTMVCAVLFYLPFWQGGGLMTAIMTSEVTQWAINSPADALIRSVPNKLQQFGLTNDEEQTRRVVQSGLALGTKLLWLAFLGVASVVVWRQPTYERFVQSCGWTLLCGLLFAAGWFWPWYVTWPLAFVPLLEWRHYGRVTTLFSASTMMIYAPWSGRPLLVFLPPLLLLAFTVGRNVKRTRAHTSLDPSTFISPPINVPLSSGVRLFVSQFRRVHR